MSINETDVNLLGIGIQFTYLTGSTRFGMPFQAYIIALLPTGMVRVNRIFTIIGLHCHYHVKIFGLKKLPIFIISGYVLYVLPLVRGCNAQQNPKHPKKA